MMSCCPSLEAVINQKPIFFQVEKGTDFFHFLSLLNKWIQTRDSRCDCICTNTGNFLEVELVVQHLKAQGASVVPVRLQTLCRGDGLGPEPLRHATVPWSYVTSRPPSSPVRISAASWIHLHS